MKRFPAVETATTQAPVPRIAFAPDEAALAAGVSRTRIFEAIRKGNLIARGDGKATIIEVTELSRWVSSLPARRARSLTEAEQPAAKKWTGTSVELDAIPVARLREIARECIERHIDQQQLEILKAAEESERELLNKSARTYGGAK